MTDVMRAQSDAEFLGMIPELAGYTATNSLVCIALNGVHSSSAFRLDLPRRNRAADWRSLTSEVIGILSRKRGIDRVAIVIYTDDTFAAHHGVPWLEFNRSLGERVHREGFHFAGFFCVAADGWCDYFDRDYPRQGHPLSDIPAAQVALPRAEEVQLPNATAAERLAFLELITDLCSGHWPNELSHVDTRDPRALIELCATWQVGDLPDALLVELSEYTQIAGCEAVALQFAFGTPARDNDVSAQFTGRGRVVPDVARLESGIRLFKRVAALAPRHYAPNALCIVAWLMWALGNSPAATYFHDWVLEIEPDHEMAQNLLSCLADGRLPEWVAA
ncbi:MAG: DUF4192 family protein [Rhodoglobus sp.]